MLYESLISNMPRICVDLIGALIAGVLTFAKFKKPAGFLPIDGGKKVETPDGQIVVINDKSAGKATGVGVIFITLFLLVSLHLVQPSIEMFLYLALMFAIMLTGYLDDKSSTPWGEYTKGILDLVLAVASAVVFLIFNSSDIVFFGNTFHMPKVIYGILAVILIWASINVTNCSDGVDGLCGSVTVIELIGYALLFWKEIKLWNDFGIILIGALIAYLYYNWNPSKVLMGDAGSRPIGYILAMIAMASGHPFIFLIMSLVFIFDGGVGLIKVAVMRFLKKPFLEKIHFPFHDHLRKGKGWAPKKVAIFFAGCEVVMVLVAALLLTIFRVPVQKPEPTTEPVTIVETATASDTDPATATDSEPEEAEPEKDEKLCHLKDVTDLEMNVSAKKLCQAGIKVTDELREVMKPGTIFEIEYECEKPVWLVNVNSEDNPNPKGTWLRAIDQKTYETVGTVSEDNKVVQYTYEQLAAFWGDGWEETITDFQAEGAADWKVTSVKVGKDTGYRHLKDVKEFKEYKTSSDAWAPVGADVSDDMRKLLKPGTVIEIEYKADEPVWLIDISGDKEPNPLGGWLRAIEQDTFETSGALNENRTVVQYSYEELTKFWGEGWEKTIETLKIEGKSSWKVTGFRIGTPIPMAVDLATETDAASETDAE